MNKVWNSKIISFFRNSPKTAVGALLIMIILVLTIGANVVTPHDPTNRYIGEYHSVPSATHLLGTTQLGNDVFAQTLYGGRKSITVGIFAGAITVFLGFFFGISSGYFGGIYDNIITTIINIMMVIPNIVLLLIIASLLGGGITSSNMHYHRPHLLAMECTCTSCPNHEYTKSRIYIFC